jgi:crotonobetainyl-CoA:carnitine CoA-transferase CaiB-like acyl-CoA transferase
VTGPLQGVRVLDLSRALAGPFCAQLLADLGAEVVKLEQPGVGDDMRHWPPMYEGLSAYYLIANRNKRSVAVDLKRPEGIEVLARLVADADVVVENFLPAVAQRLGVDQASLERMNPDVVVVSVRSYEEGRDEDRPAYDHAIPAMAGVMSITGEADGPPTRVGVAFIDFAAGLYCAVGALAALYARRAGAPTPDRVHTSLMGTATALMSLQLVSYLTVGFQVPRLGNAHPTTAPSAVYETATDPLLVLAGNDRQFVQLATAVGHPEWVEDPRFATNPVRVEHRDTLAGLLQEVLLRQPAEDWLEVLDRHGVACAPVRSVAQVADDAEVRRTMVAHVAADDGLDVPLIASPLRLDGAQLPVRSAPPPLGRDTAAVLAEVGVPPERVAALEADGVVACHHPEPTTQEEP